MQYGGDTVAPMLGSVQLEYSPLCIYRDAIRRVSVSGCRSVQFFPAISNDGSSISSASSSTLDYSSTRSISYDGDLFFSGRGGTDPDGFQELRDIALQMIHDGYLKGLIKAFRGVSSPSVAVNHGGLFRGPDPDELLLRSWFSELDVEWVLRTGKFVDISMVMRLEDGCVSLQDLMERWIRALKTMVQVLCITHQELRTTVPTVGVVRNAIRYLRIDFAAGKKAKPEEEEARFARFAEVSILKMLAFVDAVATAALNDQQAPQTLPGMLRVYSCIVDDSSAILAMFEDASNTGTASMFEDMNCIFLEKRKKLSGVILIMMEKVRVSFLINDSWQVSLVEPEGVHRSTKLMMNYIILLSRNEGALNSVLQDQQRFRMFLAETDYYPNSVVILIKDMISCLEKQLEKVNTRSGPGLRYIFLMNNCSFISQKVSSLLLPSWTEDHKIQRSRKRIARERIPSMEDYINQPDPNLLQKIETDSNLDGLVRIQRYIEAYLDASWNPVLSCLYLPYGIQGCRGALAKFKSEFKRTYVVQKMWKVPNPELRKRLRKAIVEKVISGYNMYLVDRTTMGNHNRSTPGSTPNELEEMLEEMLSPWSLLLPSWTPIDESRIHRYMETYVDISWGPVMSCLYVDTYYGLRKYSSLARFELEFQKTYATQKFWKVSNPELMQRLRKAMIEKLPQVLLTEQTTRGKSNTPPKDTPLELEELLEELFEGYWKYILHIRKGNVSYENQINIVGMQIKTFGEPNINVT
ncbi:hypothetical protein EJB05_46155, partial [Eragrostis curvula]